MATYFDASDPNDQALVQDEVSSRSDFSDLAQRAEFEVIEHYRRRKRTRTGMHDHDTGDIVTGEENLRVGIGPNAHDTDTTIVHLDYYKPDADNVESTTDGDNFKDAMRYAIANMIEHIATQRNADGGVKSRSVGARSVTYKDNLDHAVPRGVTRYLDSYDAKPTPHVL